VTVNNFIVTDKKPVDTANRTFNSRPYSSDNKERDKKHAYDFKPNKLFAYDHAVNNNVRQAFENKIGGKLGYPSNGVSKPNRKKEESKAMMANDRPNSANMADLRKGKVANFNLMVGGE
jgi:hypothetical protein